ncbi:MAG: hypothetical protein ABIJ40_19975 [Bacteroidota bacterium]
MFKKLFLIKLLALMLLFTSVNNAQVSLQLVVFEPLPAIDLASFLVNKDLKGSPRVMQFIITPNDVDVIFHMKIDWKKLGENNFSNIYEMRTKPFKSRTFYNNSFAGSDEIKIDWSEQNSELVDENRAKGKPTGTYKVIVKLTSPTGAFVDVFDEKIITFSNPAQTLTILEPNTGSTQEIGAVLATWSPVIGAANYTIRANIRRNVMSSLEEALYTGTPIINNKNVGANTSVNLRQFLDREWLPGQEIVLLVIANIPNPSGSEELKSNIVNFFIKSDNAASQAAFSQNMINVLSKLTDDLKLNLGSGNAGLSDDIDRAQRIMEMLQNGQINFQEIRITLGDGSIISFQEFQALLQYFQSNPDAIIDIRYISN